MDYHPATEADLPPWVAMRMALWGGGQEEYAKEAAAILRSPNGNCFLAIDPTGVPIGFLEVAIRHAADQTYGYLEGWYVDPGHRGQGIGRGLTEYAEEWFLQQSIETVLSDTVEDEYPESLKAHAGAGYHPVRRITVLMRDLPGS